MKINLKEVVKIIVLSAILRLHILPLEKFLVDLNVLHVMYKNPQTLIKSTRLLNIKFT